MEHRPPAARHGTRGGRAGRNLPAAIAVGLGLGAAVLAALLVYRPAFVALVAVVVAAGIWEMSRAVRVVGARPSLAPLLLGGVAMVVLAWFSGTEGLSVTFLVTVLGCLIWRLADGRAGYLRDIATASFIATYVPLLAGFAVLMAVPDDGAKRVITFLALVVCNDVAGYATGVFLGRHPMAPTVSPKKSWEGFAGSAVVCAVVGTAVFLSVFDQPWWQGAGMGVAIALTATGGDLCESMIKRDLGIKDMGSLLPGHGGMMDRLDSLLPAAAVSYVLFRVFL